MSNRASDGEFEGSKLLARFRRVPGAIYIGMVLVAGVVIALLVQHVTHTRLVARAVTPDGIELCVLQRWNGLSDPFFNTTFAVRNPGSNWHTFYFHHEDWYWGHGAVELETNGRIARVYRRGKLVITYTWRDGTYTLLRRGHSEQRSPWVMPAGWMP